MSKKVQIHTGLTSELRHKLMTLSPVVVPEFQRYVVENSALNGYDSFRRVPMTMPEFLDAIDTYLKGKDVLNPVVIHVMKTIELGYDVGSRFRVAEPKFQFA